MTHQRMIRDAELLVADTEHMLAQVTEFAPERIATATFIRDETVKLYVEIVSSSPNRQDWTSVAARLVRAMTMSEALLSPLQ